MKPKHVCGNISRIMLPNCLNKKDYLSPMKREWKAQSSSRSSLCRNSPYEGKNSNDSNHSQGTNMPIILNVFSLSADAYKSNNRGITRDISQENDIPVTPPCSPPIALIQLGTTPTISENYASCYGTCVPYDLTASSPSNSTVNSTATDNYLVYNSVENAMHYPQKITNGFNGHPPQTQNHKKHTVENQLNNKTAQRSCSVVNGYQFTESEEVSFQRGKNLIVHSNNYLANKGRFASQESNAHFKQKDANYGSKKKISANRQYVFAKLLQHIQRNQNARTKSSSGAIPITKK